MKPTPKIIHSVSLLLLGLCLATPIHAINIYVSPHGSDANNGSLHKPFATLQRAQQEARKHSRREPVTVYLRGGAYYLSETLTLTADDSGSESAPVIYRAYPNENPTVSGGAELHPTWKPYKNGIVRTSVPDDFSTDQLFVNGERQIMARYPNFDANQPIFNGYAKDAFDATRAAFWFNPSGGFMHAMHKHLWGDFHYLITGKEKDGTLLYEGGWQNNRRMGMHDKYRYVENIFDELDSPGEWYLDNDKDTLYYYPTPGLDLQNARIVSVRMRHLVEFKGNEKKPVQFVTMQGITFRHAARTFMDNKEPLLRSDWTTYRGGAVLFDGAVDCALQDCYIDRVGGNAVFVNKYNRRITLRGCHIEKAGANGVAFVGDPNSVRNPLFEYNERQNYSDIDKTPGPQNENYPSDCLVDDCLIHESGRFEKQTAPIQISISMNVTIRHCSLYDVPRAGINVSEGTFGGHVIEYCDVFDTVKETGDHGSFNSWGRDRFWGLKDIDLDTVTLGEKRDLPLLDIVKPNILRNNRWRCDRGWDIDLDDGSSRYEIYNNLCLNGGLKNREGFYRKVENNITVNNSFHPHVWYGNSRDVFRRNIVFTPYRPIGMNKGPWGKECDANLLHDPNQKEPVSASELQKQSKRDERSLRADAMFVDPDSGDYRVKENSPALKLGFKNFPMNRFGVQKPELKAIARTPRLPSLEQKQSSNSQSKRNARRVQWLGATIKNVVGLGEVSATGLPKEIGVLIVELPKQSLAAKNGLKENDVVLKCNTFSTDTLAAFLKHWNAAPPQSSVTLEIWRNQKTMSLTVTRQTE